MKIFRIFAMEDPYDSKYVLKHLSDYINFQLNQGYEPNDISDVLAKYGYKKEFINDLLKKAAVPDLKKKAVEAGVGAKEMNRELYSYLHNMLVNFIIKEKEQGYSVQAIKKALLNYGHNPEIVNSAIAFTENKGEPKMKEESKGEPYKKQPLRKLNKAQRKPIAKNPQNDIGLNINQGVNHDIKQGFNHKINPEFKRNNETNQYKTKKRSFGIPAGILYFMLVVILFAFVMFIGVATEDDILLIMLSFFPSLLSLTVVYVAILQFRSRRAVNMMAIIGIALTVLIYIAMIQLKSPVQNISDHNLVLVLNIIVSFILGFLLVIFSRLPNLEKKSDDEAIPIEHHKPDSDEKLGEQIEHGSNSLKHESRELEKILVEGNAQQGNSEINKLPERKYIPSANRRSRKRLKIKPID
jgi:hypothetical protein